jgi:hypothetical protein
MPSRIWLQSVVVLLSLLAIAGTCAEYVIGP